jgi:hypothetical protein
MPKQLPVSDPLAERVGSSRYGPCRLLRAEGLIWLSGLRIQLGPWGNQVRRKGCSPIWLRRLMRPSRALPTADRWARHRTVRTHPLRSRPEPATETVASLVVVSSPAHCFRPLGPERCTATSAQDATSCPLSAPSICGRIGQFAAAGDRGDSIHSVIHKIFL